MTNIIRKLRRNWYLISILLILLLAFFLRFYNFESRWVLAQDQSHNALVARYALQTGQIPLVGPFSSAGPFQTGGEWYWLVMISTAIYPFSVITPWIMSVVLSLVFVLLILHVGRELIDRKFGLILGILAAVSTTQLE